MSEPRTHVPLGPDGQPNLGRVRVDLLQHLPGQTQAVVDWTGGRAVLVNSAPAVLLPGTGGAVGLGDYALKYPSGRVRVEYADGVARRYQPAD